MFTSIEAIDNWQCEWVDAFVKNGITVGMIPDALDACRTKHEWPPSIKEFIDLCKPRLNIDKAYYEALALVSARKNGETGEWSHPAIYWAAMPLAYDLSHQTYSQMKERWKDALEAQYDRGEWPDVPKPSEDKKALPAPGRATMSRERAEKLVNESTAIIAARTREKGVDVSWAHKILERDKKGDRAISITVRKFAMEALGIV